MRLLRFITKKVELSRSKKNWRCGTDYHYCWKDKVTLLYDVLFQSGLPIERYFVSHTSLLEQPNAWLEFLEQLKSLEATYIE